MRKRSKLGLLVGVLVLPVAGVARTNLCTLRAPWGVSVLAEREGFEPSLLHNSKPDFESGAIDHSATSPGDPGVRGKARIVVQAFQASACSESAARRVSDR